MIRSAATIASITFFVTPNAGFGRRGQQLTCFPTSVNGGIMHWTPSKKLEPLPLTSRRHLTVCGTRVSWRNYHLLASKETCIAGLHLSCQTDNSMYSMALHHRQSLYLPESNRGVFLVLYFFFIDDLASHIENDIHLFADDSTLHIAIKNSCDKIICAEILQCDLNKIEAWADSWCVTFNASKTEEMIISRKRSQNHPPVHFMNKELQPTDSITLLGVTITKTLSWSQHITCIAKKTAKHLYILGRSRNLLPHQARITIYKAYILGRSRNLLPHQARITIYKAYIRPLVEYASPIWNGAGTTSLKLLDRLQKKALHLLKIDQPLKFGTVPLSHRRNVASFCVFYRHIFLQPSTELVNILSFDAPSMRATRYSVSEHPYCVHIPI